MHLVSSVTDFKRTHNIKAGTHRRAEAGTRPRRFPAAFIPCTVSPYSPEIVGLFVIGGFLMSPLKMFKYFFLHVLQEVNIHRLKKKNKPAVECKNEAFDNLNILKQKLSHRAERTAGKSGLWAEVEMLLHAECSALSRLNSQNVY